MSGAGPVDLMTMNDTCATHRSRVPQRSSGRIKGGATTREDQVWTLFCSNVHRSGRRSSLSLTHQPRSVPTALGPAPLITVMHTVSHGGEYNPHIFAYILLYLFM